MSEVSFIGGGNMAAAIIGGLVASGVAASQIEVLEINAEARQRLAANFGVLTHATLDSMRLSDTLVLAVKPQQLPEVAALLAPRLTSQLVLSIAAGVRVADLSRWLGGHTSLVRAMPNTPALVQAGISGLYAPDTVDSHGRSAAEAILRAVGSVVWVADEPQLDAVTAVSGSGPAYVFFCIEALEDAAIAAGLDHAVARQLALHTFFGAGKLALESGEEPASLRARVTSKGGTTERGLAALDAGGVRAAMTQAVAAAAARSLELGDDLGRLA
jgi:pyrroline-5-carboxylate reductase